MADVLVDTLVSECSVKRGCRALEIVDLHALEFVDKITELAKQGKPINIERASEILLREWSIDFPRPRLSEHLRGKCTCRKRT